MCEVVSLAPYVGVWTDGNHLRWEGDYCWWPAVEAGLRLPLELLLVNPLPPLGTVRSRGVVLADIPTAGALHFDSVTETVPCLALTQCEPTGYDGHRVPYYLRCSCVRDPSASHHTD